MTFILEIKLQKEYFLEKYDKFFRYNPSTRKNFMKVVKMVKAKF